MAIAEPSKIPPWATLVELKGWPTRAIESPDLGYRVPLPLSFRDKAERSRTPVDEEDLYRGPSDSECLSIRFMKQANPRQDIGGWVASFLHLTGFPTQAPLPPES